MISPLTLIPILLPVFNPTTVAVTAATVVLTAPSPILSAPLVPPVSDVIVTAPDPVLAIPLEPSASTVVLTAPDPERVSDNVMGVPGGQLIFSFPDPMLFGPTIVHIDGPIGLNFRAFDPVVSYGYVVNEEDFDVPAVPLQSSRDDLHRFQIAALANLTARGKIACTGRMTLIANVAATFLRDSRLGPNSDVKFDPLTEDARTERNAGVMYAPVAGRKEGQWVIMHVDDPSTDRSFRYVILG